MEEIEKTGSLPNAAGRVVLLLVCLAACAMLVFAAVGFYFGPAFALYFNSDSAVPVLLADEILRTRSVIPATWYFANDEVWTLSPHVFVLPFVATLGSSTLALKLGNLVCLGVMTALLAVLLHRITRSWSYSILAAVGTFAAFSRFQELVIYAQTAYGWFCAEFALLIYLAIRMQEEPVSELRRPARLRWTISLYVLLLVNLAIDSPLRTVVYWVVPVVAVAFVCPISKIRARKLAMWTVVAFVAGLGLHTAILGRVLAQRGTTGSVFRSLDEWGANLAIVWRALPALVADGGWPWRAVRPDIFGVVRFCFFLLAVGAVLWVPAGTGRGSDESRFFARIAGAMLLAVLGVLTVGHLAVDAGSARYLAPPLLLCLAASMAILWVRFKAHAYAIPAVAVMFAMAFSSASATLVRSQGRIEFDRSCDAPASICRLIGAVAQTGVTRGYATYWNGNVMTVASKGAITACGVVLEPHIAPFRWLVSRDCFDAAGRDRFFLAFTQSEIRLAGRERLISETGAPDRIVTADEYEIWIYSTANANVDWLER